MGLDQGGLERDSHLFMSFVLVTSKFYGESFVCTYFFFLIIKNNAFYYSDYASEFKKIMKKNSKASEV